MTFRTFSHSLIIFSAFSLHHLESQIDTYLKGHRAYKKTWTPKIGESRDVQIQTNNPVDKYTVCIRKFGKVMGHLNKGENDKFTKAIFLFLRGDPYSKAKTITSGCRCNLDDGEGIQIPCKLKLIGHQSLWTYCKMNLSEWKKFKQRNYDAKYIFFFTFCSIQCFKFVISRYLWITWEKIWVVKARVRYTEGMLYQGC